MTCRDGLLLRGDKPWVCPCRWECERHERNLGRKAPAWCIWAEKPMGGEDEHGKGLPEPAPVD